MSFMTHTQSIRKIIWDIITHITIYFVERTLIHTHTARYLCDGYTDCYIHVLGTFSFIVKLMYSKRIEYICPR